MACTQAFYKNLHRFHPTHCQRHGHICHFLVISRRSNSDSELFLASDRTWNITSQRFTSRTSKKAPGTERGLCDPRRLTPSFDSKKKCWKQPMKPTPSQKSRTASSCAVRIKLISQTTHSEMSGSVDCTCSMPAFLATCRLAKSKKKEQYGLMSRDTVSCLVVALQLL